MTQTPSPGQQPFVDFVGEYNTRSRAIMAESTTDFIPLPYASYDDAMETTRPKQIPPGTYQFQCESASFHESQNKGTPGIRFECKVVGTGNDEIDGRKLNYDGWWNTGFLVAAMLAFLGRQGWPEWSREASDQEGLTRLRDGSSPILGMLAGATATGTIVHEKSDRDGQMWARIQRFVVEE